jgi:hypothetical protein
MCLSYLPSISPPASGDMAVLSAVYRPYPPLPYPRQTAERSAAMAAEVLAAGQPDDEPYVRRLADLDFWLRSDSHRRNPGTTADLIAAGLFAALRDGRLQPPFR